LHTTVGDDGASGTFGLVDMSTASDHGPSYITSHDDRATASMHIGDTYKHYTVKWPLKYTVCVPITIIITYY